MGCARCGEAAVTVELVIDGAEWLLDLCERHLEETLEDAWLVPTRARASRLGSGRHGTLRGPEPVGP